MSRADGGALAGILAAHRRRYPLLQPQDAVKLCYQRAFGAAHFCAGEEEALRRLEQECAALTPSSGPLLEALGGEDSACRLMLGAAKQQGVPLSLTARAFALAAQTTRPDPGGFECLLQELLFLTQQKKLPFSARELEGYLATYRAAGCPAVSHSDSYRAAYAPHYRVFAGPLARLLPLIFAIEERRRALPASRRLAVALDGFSASGKTTAAGLLARLFGAAVVHMDDFFLPPELRTAQRFAQPGGNVHYERFALEVAPHLTAREPFSYRIFSCRRMDFEGEASIGREDVILVEGAYALHPACRGSYDLAAFFDIAPVRQETRIRARNGDALWERFRDQWIPLERAYAEAFSPAQQAQFLIE